MGASGSINNTIESRFVDEVEFVSTIQGHELCIVKVGSHRPEYRPEGRDDLTLYDGIVVYSSKLS